MLEYIVFVIPSTLLVATLAGERNCQRHPILVMLATLALVSFVLNVVLG